MPGHEEPVRLVTAALLVEQGRVLIAKRKAGQHLAGFWEFPGGKVEEGETPRACLRRELQEELGIMVAVGAFFGESVYRDDRGAIRLLGYWASRESGEITARAHDGVLWVYPADLNQYTFAPADRPLVEKLKATGLINRFPGGAP